MSYVATSVLIVSVLLTMQAGCDVLAFIHGWQDGPWNHDRDRHSWIPRAFYELGWRLRRARENGARAVLEKQRADTERFYAELDKAVKDELRRKDRA